MDLSSVDVEEQARLWAAVKAGAREPVAAAAAAATQEGKEEDKVEEGVGWERLGDSDSDGNGGKGVVITIDDDSDG